MLEMLRIVVVITYTWMGSLRLSIEVMVYGSSLMVYIMPDALPLAEVFSFLE